MTTIRQYRIGNENITSIKDVEEYINANYLQVISDRINAIKAKKKEVNDKIELYNSINNLNNQLIQDLEQNTKYLEIKNNQDVASPLIDELNIILDTLSKTISYKDLITLNNLNIKEQQFGTGKVSKIEGDFVQVSVPNPTAYLAAVNIAYFEDQIKNIEQPPLPLQPLKHLVTDEVGNLKWV